jgi:hypothetical protein
MKDAKGHGSEKGRGGGPHPWQRTGGWGNGANSKLAGRLEKAGFIDSSGQAAHMTAIDDESKRDAWSNTPGGDREAAHVLSSGGPKSDPAPVHEAMHHAMHNAISGPSYTGNAAEDRHWVTGTDKASGQRVGYRPVGKQSMKIDGREG